MIWAAPSPPSARIAALASSPSTAMRTAKRQRLAVDERRTGSSGEFHQARNRLAVDLFALVGQVVQGHYEHGPFRGREREARAAQLLVDRSDDPLEQSVVQGLMRCILVRRGSFPHTERKRFTLAAAGDEPLEAGARLLANRAQVGYVRFRLTAQPLAHGALGALYRLGQGARAPIGLDDLAQARGEAAAFPFFAPSGHDTV